MRLWFIWSRLFEDQVTWVTFICFQAKLIVWLVFYSNLEVKLRTIKHGLMQYIQTTLWQQYHLHFAAIDIFSHLAQCPICNKQLPVGVRRPLFRHACVPVAQWSVTIEGEGYWRITCSNKMICMVVEMESPVPRSITSLHNYITRYLGQFSYIYTGLAISF